MLERFKSEVNKLVASKDKKALYRYKHIVSLMLVDGTRLKCRKVLGHLNLFKLKRNYVEDHNPRTANIIAAKLISSLNKPELRLLQQYIGSQLD